MVESSSTEPGLSISDPILITGGAGFIGSHLAVTLRTRFPHVRVLALDNLRRRGSEWNLARLRDAGVHFLHGDVRNPEDLANLPACPELILECSAEPSVLAGYRGDSPDYLVKTNLLGSYNCLELARRCGSKLIFLSTSRVYSMDALNSLLHRESETRFELLDRQHLPAASALGISETFQVSGPRSLYGMTKLCSELMIEEYTYAYGLRAIVNRCGLITGPGQMGKLEQGVIALWMIAHYFRRPLAYIGFGGKGKQVRDFLHVGDLTDLVIRQIGDFDRYEGKTFNVGGGLKMSLSLQEATQLCREVTGNKIAIQPVPENRPADVRIFLTDHRKITEIGGWSPSTGARETFQDIYKWIRCEEQRIQTLTA